MKFDFQDELIQFVQVERTWQEITTKFQQYSMSAIAICLRQLEQENQVKVHVKYQVNHGDS